MVPALDESARGKCALRPLDVLRATWSPASGLTEHARAVLTAIVLRADNATGITWPIRADRLAALAGVSRATCFRALLELGWIVERIHRRTARAEGGRCGRTERAGCAGRLWDPGGVEIDTAPCRLS